MFATNNKILIYWPKKVLNKIWISMVSKYLVNRKISIPIFVRLITPKESNITAIMNKTSFARNVYKIISTISTKLKNTILKNWETQLKLWNKIFKICGKSKLYLSKSWGKMKKKKNKILNLQSRA